MLTGLSIRKELRTIMTIDFADKLGTFVIINQKLDGIQRDIAYAFNMPVFKDNNLTCSYWKQPHIYALSKLETRIQDAKRITEKYIQILGRVHINKIKS